MRSAAPPDIHHRMGIHAALWSFVLALWFACEPTRGRQLDGNECTANLSTENGVEQGADCTAACPDLASHNARLRACDHVRAQGDGGQRWFCTYVFDTCADERRWRQAPRDAGPRCGLEDTGTCTVVGEGACCTEEAWTVDGVRSCLAPLTPGHSTYACAHTADPALCPVDTERSCYQETFVPARVLVFLRRPADATIHANGLQPCDEATAAAAISMPNCP